MYGYRGMFRVLTVGRWVGLHVPDESLTSRCFCRPLVSAFSRKLGRVPAGSGRILRDGVGSFLDKGGSGALCNGVILSGLVCLPLKKLTRTRLVQMVLGASLA